MMSRNEKVSRVGGGAATSARTSPAGIGTAGASGPATLKALADVLNQDAVGIADTAYGLLARHADTVRLPSVQALMEHVREPTASTSPAQQQQQQHKAVVANGGGVGLLVYDAATCGAAPSNRQQQQQRATPANGLLVACIDALAALLSKLPQGGGGGGSAVAHLGDGSAASQTQLDVFAALLRVPLLFLLGDRQLPGGGGGKQHGGSGGGMRMRNKPQPSTGCTSSSSSSQQSYVNTLIGATVALSTVGIFAVTTPRQGLAHAAGSMDHMARTAEQEVRALSLFLIAAIAQGHPDLLVDCLPTLLPDVTSMEGLVNGSAPSSCKYPLLTPLALDKVYRCRAAASTALIQILQKSQQRLALAAEPGPKDRQSFTSMSTGLGRMLRDVHAVVLYGLTNRDTASVRSLFLSVAGGLAVVTPYAKCAHAQAAMLKIIQLPFLADVLSAQKPPSDYGYACAFLGSVWRAKALQPAIVGGRATAASPTTATAAAPSAWGRGRGGGTCNLASSPTTTSASPTTTACLPAQTMPRLVALVVSGLPAIEALRALTHVARSYPTAYLTHAQTDTIIDLAEEILAPKDATATGGSAATTATVQEMLRLLMHICGLAWEPFQQHTTSGNQQSAEQHHHDGGGGDDDEATTTATAAGAHPVATATPEQRLRVLKSVYARTVRRDGSAALRTATYKCLGQIGDDVFCQVLSPIGTAKRNGSADGGNRGGAAAPSFAYLVDDIVSAATQEREATARAEALVTLGVWALRYPQSCGSVHHLSQFTDVAIDRLQHDADDEVRAKAVFVLSNVCAQQATATFGVGGAAGGNDGDSAAEQQQLRLKLCQAVGIAVHVANACRATRGVSGQSAASVVAGHSVRMMQFLLKSLDSMTLIMELPGHPEGIVSFFLEQLERYLHSPPMQQPSPCSGSSAALAAAAAACWDVKTRWNAAYAMGEVLSNPTIYGADPPAARACFDTLMVAVVRDSNFKVRTRSVGAVEKIVEQLKAPRRLTPATPAVSSTASSIGTEASTNRGKDGKQNPTPQRSGGGRHVDCGAASTCTAAADRRTTTQQTQYEEEWTHQMRCAYQKDWAAKLPTVLDALCEVLGRLQEESGAAQFREAGLLQTELLRAVQSILDAAPGSCDFQEVLAKHKQQLVEAGLL